MNTSNLLQNTPAVVDMHKSNFLHRGRTLNMMPGHKTGTNSPGKHGISPVENSYSQIGGFADLSTISVANPRSRFSPPLKNFKEPPESRLGTQRREAASQLRPQPRVVYK